jgi:hypothetical protein
MLIGWGRCALRPLRCARANAFYMRFQRTADSHRKRAHSAFRTRLPDRSRGRGYTPPDLRQRGWGRSRLGPRALPGSPFMHCLACGARQPLRPRGLRVPSGASALERCAAVRPLTRALRTLPAPPAGQGTSSRQSPVNDSPTNASERAGRVHAADGVPGCLG